MYSNGSVNGVTRNGSELKAHAAELNNGLSHDHKSTEQFVEEALELVVVEGLKKAKMPDSPVVNFRTPENLKEKIDFQLNDEAESNSKLLDLCQKVFDYSVKTAHPHFFNQLFAGLDPHAFVGQVITDVLNPSIYTYEVSPVFVMMEKVLLAKFREMVEFPEGDGTFAPGGSYSNMLGMNLARFRTFPDVKKKGMCQLPRLVALTSRHCHYSNKKNASLLGVGSDNVIAVDVDGQGRMDPVDLERRIVEAQNNGSAPFVVIATSGTTVLGAYDPLERIADVCEKYKIWLHVDAAWGGGALISDKHRHLCKGIHRADSVAWNPHKMLMAPLQCCMFLTRHKDLLKTCHAIHVPYLFQADKTLYSVEYDVGSKVIQCGRKVDSMKLWLMWKAKGTNGLKSRIDKAFENARYLTKLVRNRPGFKLVLAEPECTNVCFWYLPPSMRDLQWNLNDESFCRKLASIAPLIKERMTERGSMLVGYQPVDQMPNFIRMVVINDEISFHDMEFVVNEIDDLGKDL